MSFSDIFDEQMEATILDVLGDDVLYGSTPIKAIVDYNSQNVAVQESFGVVPQIVITALKTDVPGVKRDSKFFHLGKKLIVDSVSETAMHYVLVVRRG